MCWIRPWPYPVGDTQRLNHTPVILNWKCRLVGKPYLGSLLTMAINHFQGGNYHGGTISKWQPWWQIYIVITDDCCFATFTFSLSPWGLSGSAAEVGSTDGKNHQLRKCGELGTAWLMGQFPALLWNMFYPLVNKQLDNGWPESRVFCC